LPVLGGMSSIFEVTVVTDVNTNESTPQPRTRMVRADTFAEAIAKIEADYFSKLELPAEHYVTDCHAEWRPDLEDIIE
jgi:hypothetical protein